MNENNILKDKKRAGILSLVIGLVIFVIKVSAYFLTGSTAIFSDAAESVVHIVATVMALYSIYLSAKPADKNHLYGHGNVEYFSAGVEGFLIITAAVTIIYSSVNSLINGVEITKIDTGTYLIAFSGLVNLGLGLFLIKEGKRTKSLTLVADGHHVLTDSYTSIGIVIGLILVLFTDIKIIDPIIAIIVAFNILITGYKLIRESIGGLMKETDPELLKYLTTKISSFKKDYWIDVHNLKFFKSSDRLFLDFHIILPYYFTIEKAHIEENALRDEIQKDYPFTEVRIHTDYCKPEVCKFCEFKSCKERTEEKSISFNWDERKILGEPIYDYNLEDSNTK